MKNLFLLFFILLWSCSNQRTDKIIVPELESNFYSKAMNRINEELKSAPENQKLVDQKLFYCQQLDWPTTCISALDTYKSQNGMTNQLFEQYIFYYSKHERYQLLINVIDRWSEEYTLKEQFHKPLIEALVRLNMKDRAIDEIRSYMMKKSNLTDFEFTSIQYLAMKDTLMAAYYLGKVAQLDPSNELMSEYGQILIKLDYVDHGFRILEEISPSKSSDKKFKLTLARLYARHSKFVKARNIAFSFANEDTISYLISNWYMKEYKWDSAVHVLDAIIDMDSLNTKAIWKKARIYKSRGLLNTSVRYFNSILLIQPDDTITSSRIALIQRKIAYLQRKKFEDSKIQIREIEPIKFNQ